MIHRLAVLVGLLLAAAQGHARSIDYHFNGMWYQPELSGHGLNLAIQPTASGDGQTVFVTFFTYDDDGAANFYAGNVDVVDWQLGSQLTLPMQQTADGGFSSPRPIDFSDPVQFADAGSITLRLDDCASGEVSYQLRERSGGGSVEQQFAIEKLIGVPQALCETVAAKGAIERSTTIGVLGLSDYKYFLYVPTDYDPQAALPLMIAWHGAAGPGQAEGQAQVIRDLWIEAAEQNGLIILAQTGTSENGSWIPSNAAVVLGQLLKEINTDYAVDPQRIYGWGFSAGGHVMHSIALANTDLFAGYAVNAGALNAVVGQGRLGDVARALPVSSLIGSSDTLLAEARGDRQAFVDAGWLEGQSLFYREFTGGHTVSADHPAEHWSHLRDQMLPRPASLKQLEVAVP